MSTQTRKLIAVASLLAFSSLLNGCAINPEANKKNSELETACSNSVKDFDSGATPTILITALPAGVYAHANAEVYVKNSLSSTSTNGATDTNEVQVLETPNDAGSPTPFSTSTLCKDTNGTFRPYFEQTPMVVGFTHFTNGDFTPSSNTYAIIYNTDQSPAYSVGATTVSSRSNPTSLASTIINYWNTNYHFVRIATNTYAFYGVHTDSFSGRVVYGKAVYTRTDLPAGTL
jgi:hypothetical protein